MSFVDFIVVVGDVDFVLAWFEYLSLLIRPPHLNQVFFWLVVNEVLQQILSQLFAFMDDLSVSLFVLNLL